VIGLDLGADDYLAKPFGMMEMVSRVKAVLRRTMPKKEMSILKVGGLELNTIEHTVSANGIRIVLTLKEYKLLYKFMDNLGRVFTREQLLQSIWGSDYVGETRTVDVHIGTLRSKLGECGDYIETVRGVGYRMEARL
jgi:two-component system alkaline phosphatase synthesis response regulator PhoP